jgi:hypothetical protein
LFSGPLWLGKSMSRVSAGLLLAMTTTQRCNVRLWSSLAGALR